jgi:hypothetical protein
MTDWADEIVRKTFATPVPRELPFEHMWRWTENNFAEALRRARRDALEEAEEARLGAAAWIETWTQHVGNCKGGLECTCGRTAILFELSAMKDMQP